jgi:hypothetical protein
LIHFITTSVESKNLFASRNGRSPGVYRMSVVDSVQTNENGSATSEG